LTFRLKLPGTSPGAVKGTYDHSRSIFKIRENTVLQVAVRLQDLFNSSVKTDAFLGKVQIVSEFFFQGNSILVLKLEYYKESSHKCSVSPLAVLFVPKITLNDF
jgi:hypothetical protein